MKKWFVLCCVFISTALFAQTKLLSWNIENLGSSKSNTEITFITNTLRDFDIMAIQEVVAGDGGATR